MPSERFNRTVIIGSDPATTWTTVTDIDSLVSWISILGDVQEHERLSHYSARLTDRIGMFSLSADLDIRVTSLEEGARVDLEANGRDRQVDSSIYVVGSLGLVPHGDGTQVTVDGQYEVTGRVATFGSPMIRMKADKIISEFVDGLARTSTP